MKEKIDTGDLAKLGEDLDEGVSREMVRQGQVAMDPSTHSSTEGWRFPM
jgi:hypothetical protein